tara:strand:+ start:921 stop:1466 length:546 start_codon:yes stop_codon:yes gene_type:complete
MNIDNYIYCKNYINNNECDHLLELMQDYQWQKHKWYSPLKDQIHHKKKDCEVCMPKEEVKDILINKIKLSLNGYVKKIKPTSEIFHKFVNPRLNKYSVGQNMKEHFDHIHSIFDGDLKGIPILSLVGLLNDKFEGGEFYLNNKLIELNKGDILIFPSCFIYPHTVKSITKGNRFTYVSWAF